MNERGVWKNAFSTILWQIGATTYAMSLIICFFQFSQQLGDKIAKELLIDPPKVIKHSVTTRKECGRATLPSTTSTEEKGK